MVVGLLLCGRFSWEREEEEEENRKHRRESFGGRVSRICSSAKPICRRRPCKRVDAIESEKELLEQDRENSQGQSKQKFNKDWKARGKKRRIVVWRNSESWLVERFGLLVVWSVEEETEHCAANILYHNNLEIIVRL